VAIDALALAFTITISAGWSAAVTQGIWLAAADLDRGHLPSAYKLRLESVTPIKLFFG
jgi:hypothetical protein